MPPRARAAAKPKEPTYFMLGVYGQGASDEANVTALLDDLISGLDLEADVKVRFLLPLSTSEFTPTVEAVLTYAESHEKEGYDFAVIFTKAMTARGNKDLYEIQEAAADKIEVSVALYADTFAETLAVSGSDNARLLFLWGDGADDPGDDEKAVLFSCADRDIVVLDLTNGLAPIDVRGEDEDAEDTSEPEQPAAASAPANPDVPERSVTEEWPVRRLRSLAKKEGMPDDEADAADKDGLLDFLYGSAPAAETPKEEPASTTPRRARAVREEIEKDGEDPSAHAKAALKAQAPKSQPVDNSGDVSEEARSLAQQLGNILADIIIDRIAERVSAEPAGSPVRNEVAPPRPPGRPRSSN